MRKHILIVSGIYPPDAGGPAKFALDFSKFLLGENCDVTVISYSDSAKLINEMNPNFTLVLVPRNKNIVFRICMMILQICKYYKKESKVLAIGAFIETLFASLLKRFNYIAKIPGDIVWERARNSGHTTLEIVNFQKEKLNLSYSMLRVLFNTSLNRAEFIICPSKFLKTLCLQWRIPESKIRVIYNSVSIEEKIDILKPKYDVITVCRLVPWKGVAEIIEVCHKLKMTLLVIGDGPEMNNLRSLARAKDVTANFTGNISFESVKSHYPLAKYFILNSTYEGLPHALLEAKTSGLICVARGGHGSEEVLTDKWDGFIVDGSKECSLELLLKDLQSGFYNLDAIRENALNDARNRFDQRNNFPKILELLCM